MALVKENSINILSQDISGYASDDESSEIDEPMDAGKTRSSSRKTNQPASNSNIASDTKMDSGEKGDSNQSGRKRKKNVGAGGDGSGSDEENSGGDRSRLKVEPSQIDQKVVCSCPKNVMRCIGILPSLPIVSYFNDIDSDDTDSSLDDLSHVVLPTVSRQEKESC